MQTAARCAQRFIEIVTLSLLIALVTTAGAGCAQTAGELAESAASPATSGTLDELSSDEGKRQLNELLTLPGVSILGERLSRGFVRGMLWTMNEELDPAQVEALAQTLIDGLSPALVRSLEGEMGRSLETIATRMTDAVLGGMLGPQARQEAISFVRALARTATQAAMQVVSEQLREEIGPAIAQIIREEAGPAMAQVIREEVGPAMTQMMRDEAFREALGETAHTVGRQSVLGVNAGLRDLREEAPEGTPTPLEGVQQVISQGEETLQTVLWMLGIAVLVLLLVVIVLGIGLWRSMAKSHELIEESKVREESLSDMAHAVSAAEESKD